MKMITKTKKVGGSLMVVVPKKMIDAANIKEGEEVEIEVRKVKKKDFRKYFGAFKGVGPWTKEDRFDSHYD